MSVDWVPYVEVAAQATTADLTAVETRLGVRLPDDVREALIERGGMAPTRDRIAVGTGGTAFGPLLVFHGSATGASSTYSIAFAIEALKEWKGTTDDKALKLMPFASNTASGYFCLDFTQQSNRPPVVFVDIEYEPDERGAITAVGDSVTEVFSMLH